MKINKSLQKSIVLGLSIFAGLIIYAYGFEITKVSLDQLRSPQRQESLARVTRALFQPDIFAYEQEEVVVNAPVYVPCPADGSIPAQPEVDTSTAYIIITPTCGAPGETVQVEGFNFAPNVAGPLRFVPGNDPNYQVSLGRADLKTDADGHFFAEFELPKRESEDVQYIRAVGRRNIGTPHLTQTAYDTWEKIIETVFLALLATTLGTIFAIPLSFIAARNLMKNVKSPLAKISLSLLGWPIGLAFGFWVVNYIGNLTAALTENIFVNIISVILAGVIIWFAIRWAMPEEELTKPKPSVQVARLFVLFLTVLLGFFGLFQLAGFTTNLGTAMMSFLGKAAFLGNFMFQLSDVLRILTPTLGGLAAGGVLSSVLGNLGQRSTEALSDTQVKILNYIVAAVAGATLFGLLGALIKWVYEIENPVTTFYGPVISGALFGIILATITKAKQSLPVGMVIYLVTRTFLNTLRSIEALVMAIVFVIAVGIGPFAGVLALGLHTIVSLAKLYSEQVESISAGPLEAVEATGANRLQTIIYAVVPQIVPPYISYTMYRWDINVRMSTIIGFVGGGGIGFLLQQNINLLNYRAASAQMLAIAVVVASMDYISSVLREKVV
jgi:phosphonate ABC transporter permease subunit PhnE